MNTESRLNALISSAIFDSYNSSLRKVYKDIYNERTLVWNTTGKNNVCEICKDMHGVEVDIDETDGLMPVHPECCCTWLSKGEV